MFLKISRFDKFNGLKAKDLCTDRSCLYMYTSFVQYNGRRHSIKTVRVRTIGLSLYMSDFVIKKAKFLS